MDKSLKHFKFTMVFLAPVVTLFFFNSLILLALEQYFFMFVNFFVFLCILTLFASKWNQFMDRFTAELKVAVETADSVNCSAQMLDREVKKLMQSSQRVEMVEIHHKIKELLIYSREQAKEGGPAGLVHLKLARELVSICSQLNTPLQTEVSEVPLVMIDCILLNSDKIKTQMVSLGDNFNKPIKKTIKLKRRDFFVRTIPAYRKAV